MKMIQKNATELVLGIGLTLFLVNFFTQQNATIYTFSIPFIVTGSLMMYKRHFQPNTSLNTYNFFENDDTDDLYDDAKEAVIEAGKISTAYLQRKLRIGYSRAARLIDLLEEKGVITPGDGAKPRDVLVSKK